MCRVLQDKREKVRLHEDAAVSCHMLLVMRSNTNLEQQVRLRKVNTRVKAKFGSSIQCLQCCLHGQVEVLQEEALLRQQEVQTDSLVLAGLQKKIQPVLQQSSSHEHVISTAQV